MTDSRSPLVGGFVVSFLLHAPAALRREPFQEAAREAFRNLRAFLDLHRQLEPTPAQMQLL
jgi:hypothetical protein